MLKHVIFGCALLAAASGVRGAEGAALPLAAEDRPLSVRQTVLPEFPRSLLEAGVREGRARVVIDVDEAGMLADWLVVSHTRPEFGDAAVRAIQGWEFAPLVLRDRPTGSQVLIGFDFQARGVVIDIRPGTNVTTFLFSGFGNHDYRPRHERELDRIPFLLTPVEPSYGSALKAAGVMGSATVEFYIDESGAVRMPAIVAADFPELGDLAIQAVRQWTFEPPTARGKPVLAHVRQRFDFGLAGN